VVGEGLAEAGVLEDLGDALGWGEVVPPGDLEGSHGETT
jgi:hypothetical protein